jgi:hypothetical protein
LQKDLSRKAKGSNNRKKAVVTVARAHARVADTRRDWHHKLSTAIIRDNQAVYVEDLCVVGLGRTRLAKSVHDAGWASFTAMVRRGDRQLITMSRAVVAAPLRAPATPISAPLLIAVVATVDRFCTTRTLSPYVQVSA